MNHCSIIQRTKIYNVYLGIIYGLGLYSKLHKFSLKFLATLENIQGEKKVLTLYISQKIQEKQTEI